MNLSSQLMDLCREKLLECEEFDNIDTLRAVFIRDELRPYRDRLPARLNSKSDLVDQTLALLSVKKTSDRTSVLALLLSTLAERHQREVLGNELFELSNRTLEASSVNVMIPIAIAAMNQDEVAEFSEGVALWHKGSDEAEVFDELKRELTNFSIDVTEFRASYGPERQDWKPLGGKRGQSIQSIVSETLAYVNQRDRIPWNLPPLVPRFDMSEQCLSADRDVRMHAREVLVRSQGILVVDAISFFHPVLRQRILKLEVGAEQSGVAILIVTPTDGSELPINRLLQQAIYDHFEMAFDRYEKLDQFCEIGVASALGLKRWLKSVLTGTNANNQIGGPNPVKRQQFRQYAGNPEPRGMQRLIYKRAAEAPW